MPRTWLDRIVQYPRRFKDQNGNTLTLTPDPGTITQEGTPVNAAMLNGIETDLIDNVSYAEDTGTPNNVVVSIPGITAYKEGQKFKVKLKYANSGATTFKVNTLAAIKVVQSCYPSEPIISDYTGKIKNSTVENPNIIKRTQGTTVQLPSVAENTDAYHQDVYNAIAVLGAPLVGHSVTASQNMAQLVFSFDVIKWLEKRIGQLPCPQDLASKVAWAKANIDTAIGRFNGYGTTAYSNKVYFTVFVPTSNTWSGTVLNHSNNNAATQLAFSMPAGSIRIDDNGFIHFVAYTDVSPTTSTLVQSTNHGLSQWDIVDNVTRNYLGATVTAINNANVFTTTSIPSQWGGDTLKLYHEPNGQLYPCIAGTTDTTVKITAHGLSTGDYVKNSTRGNLVRRVTVVDADTFTVASVSGQVPGDNFLFLKYTKTITAEAGTAVLYTDYVSLDITLKAKELAPGDVRAGQVIEFIHDGTNVQMLPVNNKVDNSDFVRSPAFATTSGTSTAYTISTTPVPAAYVDGMSVTIVPHVDSGANPTLNWNGLGAGALLYPDGSGVQLKANKPYSFVRVGSNFFIRSGGSNIKSIQRGVTTLNGTTSTDATIGAIDTSKAIVKVYVLPADYNTSIREAAVSAEIVNGTTIRFSTNVISSTDKVYWEVIEFYNVKSKQSGSYTLSATGEQSVTISAIDPNKAMIIATATSDYSNIYYSAMQFAAYIANSTTIKFEYRKDTQSLFIKWQVIEFN